MKRNKILEKIRKNRSRHVDIFVDYTFDLSNRIQFLLDKKSMDQKDLAKALDKNESEISKWLSGSHNFTLKTVAKIEEILEGKLLEIVNEETLNNEENIRVYLINSEHLYKPRNYNKTTKNIVPLKKYSPNYKNTVLADC